MSEGHPEARHYPVPRLWTETRLVKTRMNREAATSSLLMQSMISSVFSKDGAKAFEKQINVLMGK